MRTTVLLYSVFSSVFEVLESSQKRHEAIKFYFQSVSNKLKTKIYRLIVQKIYISYSNGFPSIYGGPQFECYVLNSIAQTFTFHEGCMKSKINCHKNYIISRCKMFSSTSWYRILWIRKWKLDITIITKLKLPSLWDLSNAVFNPSPQTGKSTFNNKCYPYRWKKSTTQAVRQDFFVFTVHVLGSYTADYNSISNRS